MKLISNIWHSISVFPFSLAHLLSLSLCRRPDSRFLSTSSHSHDSLHVWIRLVYGFWVSLAFSVASGIDVGHGSFDWPKITFQLPQIISFTSSMRARSLNFLSRSRLQLIRSNTDIHDPHRHTEGGEIYFKWMKVLYTMMMVRLGRSAILYAIPNAFAKLFSLFFVYSEALKFSRPHRLCRCRRRRRSGRAVYSANASCATGSYAIFSWNVIIVLYSPFIRSLFACFLLSELLLLPLLAHFSPSPRVLFFDK